MKGCHTLCLHPPASPAVSFIPFHRRNCSAIKSTRAWPRKPGPAFLSSRTEMCTQTLAPTVFMESESLPGCYFVHPPPHPPTPLSNPSFLRLFFTNHLCTALALVSSWMQMLVCSKLPSSYGSSPHTSSPARASYRLQGEGSAEQRVTKAQRKLQAASVSPNQCWHRAEIVNKTSNQAANICKQHFG